MEKISFKYRVTIAMYIFCMVPYQKTWVTFTLADTIMNPEDRLDCLHFYFYMFQ